MNKFVLVAVATTAMIPSLASADWYSYSETDEMTEVTSAWAISPKTKPTKRMSFPYQDLESWVAYGCNGSEEWVHVGFDTKPNLTGGQNHDGFSVYNVKYRFDDEKARKGKVYQIWGDKFLELHPFTTVSLTTAKIMMSNQMMIGLSWYGQNGVVVKYDLRGSTKSIKEARKMCGLTK